MKHDYKRMMRRIFGGKLAWHVEYYADCATLLQNAIDERVNDPRKVERKLQALAEENTDRIRKANKAASHAAADEGEIIVEQKRVHGGGAGWVAFLASKRYTRSTAYNRIAMYLFRRDFPDLFNRFALLGKTKCLRVAMLPEKVVRPLTVQTVVKVPGGKETALEYLTDDQLSDYLRTLSPPEHRPRRKVLKYALRAAERAASDANYPSEGLSREDAEAARDAAQRVVNRLSEALRTG